MTEAFDFVRPSDEQESVQPLLETLTERFAAAIVAAHGAEHAQVDPALRRSDRADFQADVAMRLARAAKKPPRDVAAAIVEKLDLGGIAERVEIAGPGFINVWIDNACLSKHVAAVAAEANGGIRPAAKPQTVVIDYSSPNIAKELHVGHLRSTIIGDAIARVLESLGHKVVRQNHLGDWGTPFGMLIENLVDIGGDKGSFSLSDLDAFYRQARTKFDADPSFADRSRKRVVLLQSGDEETLKLWRAFVDASTRYISEIYERLGVTLRKEDICGESFYNPMLSKIVSDLDAKGLLRESDGAKCVFPPGFTNKEGEPLPLIVQKSDGGFGYAATDLAGVIYRTQKLGASRVLVVVGAPQQQHLAMVFAVAREAGWLTDSAEVVHVPFGSVLGPDKKIFKTRSGATIKLLDLIDEATQRAALVAKEKNPELGEAQSRELGAKIGVGAIKYADLSSDRIKDYVFDWDRMLSPDGNTGPYLQYAHARTQSILRKADAPGDPSTIAVAADAERVLALTLLSFGEAVETVGDGLQPHKLCTYLYDLASAFTSFYDKCPVLRAEDEATRASRLALTAATGRSLAKGLDLLGIAAPDRM